MYILETSVALPVISIVDPNTILSFGDLQIFTADKFI